MVLAWSQPRFKFELPPGIAWTFTEVRLGSTSSVVLLPPGSWLTLTEVFLSCLVYHSDVFGFIVREFKLNQDCPSGQKSDQPTSQKTDINTKRNQSLLEKCPAIVQEASSRRQPTSRVALGVKRVLHSSFIGFINYK